MMELRALNKQRKDKIIGQIFLTCNAVDKLVQVTQ